MAKKNKTPEYAPKKYRVIVSRYGPNFSVSVEQVDKNMMAHSNRLTLSFNGLSRHNSHSGAEVFNLMHNALTHVLGARYPAEVEHVMEYADRFFNGLDMDVMNGVSSGDEITFEVQEMDFSATLPSSEKTRKLAHGDSFSYKYEFFGEKGDRNPHLLQNSRDKKPTPLAFQD